MHQEILPRVIFSPGHLAINLAEGLQRLGHEVTLFSPGPLQTRVTSSTADLTYFAQELARRDDTYLELLKKHPFTFITLARQVQTELIVAAIAEANRSKFDIVHVYCNEEEIALPLAQLCTVPVVFTHHDPFNFLVKYKSIFPKYKHLPWLSISNAQRRDMPADTNWLTTIYHGIDSKRFSAQYQSPKERYVAYLGRIIQPKGVHLAIAAIKQYNQRFPEQPYKLKIAGKHYSGVKKDTYWQEYVQPELDGVSVEYVGFLSTDAEKQEFLGNACALVIPSTFEEPFGMVMIESLACGTPVIGLDSGAIPEVITDKTGVLVKKHFRTVEGEEVLDEDKTVEALVAALARIDSIDRPDCRRDFEERFTLERMCQAHLAAYRQVLG